MEYLDLLLAGFANLIFKVISNLSGDLISLLPKKYHTMKTHAYFIGKNQALKELIVS